MDKKYGAFLCTGCGIGDALNIDALSKVTSSEGGMECITHPALCSLDGRAIIEKSISEKALNVIVIGACSPRVWEDEFNFGDDKKEFWKKNH